MYLVVNVIVPNDVNMSNTNHLHIQPTYVLLHCVNKLSYTQW